MMRENNSAPPPFAPGDAERRLGPLLDAQSAQRIVRSSNFPLVAAVRDSLVARARAAADGADSESRHG
jgi:hypothetical protein